MKCLLSSLMIFLSSLGVRITADIGDTIGNALEDAFNFVYDKLKETMADGIIGNINSILDLVSKGLSPHGELSPDGHSYLPSTNGIYTTVKDLMLTHPKNFSLGNPWTNIRAISEDLIVPIATTFIAIIAVYDLYQMVVVNNTMHDFDSSVFIRWIIKTQIALTLTSNAFAITEWIFQFGSDIAFATVGGSDNWLSSLASNPGVSMDQLKASLMEYDFGTLCIVWILGNLTLAAVFLMFAAIVIGLMGRLIEMYMYMSIAPIPIATLMNNETKGIGDSWVRGALGVSFQVFFIIVALTLFGSFFQTTVNNIVNGQNIIWDYVKLTAFSITLIMTILRSGQISKGMFGAH